MSVMWFCVKKMAGSSRPASARGAYVEPPATWEYQELYSGAKVIRRKWADGQEEAEVFGQTYQWDHHMGNLVHGAADPK